MSVKCAVFVFLVYVFLLALTSCSPIHIDQNRELNTLALKQKSVSILTGDVSHPTLFCSRPASFEEIKQQMMKEEMAIQKEVCTYLHRYTNLYTVIIQSVEQTNLLLGQAGVTPDKIRRYSRQELATLLGVDGLKFTTISHKQSGNMGTAVVPGAVISLVGLPVAISHNRPKTYLEIPIYDSDSEKTLWKLAYTCSELQDITKIPQTSLFNIFSKFPYKWES